MTRAERRALDRLIDSLRDCSDDLADRLLAPRWWETAAFARAMCALTLYGASTVHRELGVGAEPGTRP
jgi:hypothetical protein